MSGKELEPPKFTRPLTLELYERDERDIDQSKGGCKTGGNRKRDKGNLANIHWYINVPTEFDQLQPESTAIQEMGIVGTLEK